MIRIAIVEDDRNDMQILRGYLSRYEQENSAHFQVSTFSDGLDIVSDYKAEYLSLIHISSPPSPRWPSKEWAGSAGSR